MATAVTDASARSSGVLTRAVVRATHALGLAQKTLAAMLGVSEATVSRFARGRMIDPRSKEGELAVLFVRLFRSLDAMVGGDVDKARAWIHADNHHLDGAPVELIQTVSGLLHVTEYLDALRGKS